MFLNICNFFINLIDNAIKYNHKNSRIKISFFDPDKNYLIKITDKPIHYQNAEAV